jgi:polygalacturonase
VAIVGVTVRCPWNAQNGDGIDLMHSSDVLVADCTVDVGDDGICLKAGGGPKAAAQGATERILIRRNTVFHAHGGFVIGSEFSAGIRDVAVLDNTFSGTDTGLRFKSAPGRGGVTSRVRIRNVWMSDIRDQAIVFQTAYVNVPVGERGKSEETAQFMPEFCDIEVDGLVCRDARIGVSARGTAAMIHDISLRNCRIFWTEAATDLSSPDLLDLSGVELITW